MTEAEAPKDLPTVTIKKYANRRLYNTASSSYVTLDHLARMVKEGQDFVVYDAKTGEDITRSVLTQIIVEMEGRGQNLLPTSFLRNLISMYGDNLQWMVPGYLDHSMQSFSRNQDRMREYFSQTVGTMFPLNTFEEMSKQNLAMFEQAMRMFSPFGVPPLPGQPGFPGQAATESAAAAENGLGTLQKRLDELEKELSRLSRGKPPAG